MKKSAFQILKIAFTIALIAYILHKVGARELWGQMKAIRPANFAMAFGLFFSSIFLLAVRWRLLLTARGIHAPLRSLFGYYLVAMFFNMILPMQVGGDVMRALDLGRHTDKSSEAWASIIIERIIGLLSLVTLASLSVMAGRREIDDPRIVVGVFAFLAALAVVLTTLFNARALKLAQAVMSRITVLNIGPTINKIYDAFYGYKNKPAVLVGVLLFSSGLQVLNILAYYVLSLSLVEGVKVFYFFVNIPIASVMANIPISVGGTGLLEGVIAYLFKGRIPEESSFAFAFAYRGLMFSAAMIGAILYLTRRSGAKRAVQERVG